MEVVLTPLAYINWHWYVQLKSAAWYQAIWKSCNYTYYAIYYYIYNSNKNIQEIHKKEEKNELI